MNEVLKEILQTNEVQDENGMVYKLHSHTNANQGLELQRIINQLKPAITLEIGLAYGISSLFILEALKKNNGKKHFIIEPFPDIYWNNIGLNNIKKAGYFDLIDFRKDFSYNVLPKLHYENERIDFAYIDTTKVFDIVLTDFFFIDKLLNVEGVVVFDDVTFPGIRKIARFLCKNPNYKIVLQHHKDKKSLRLRILNQMQRLLVNLIPFKDRYSSDISFESDEELGIDYHCLGFKKISEDLRNWDWFERF